MNSPNKKTISPYIQIALATGISIIIMAYFSKRVFTEPIGYLSLAVPPFIASIFSGFYERNKESAWFKPAYWIAAIFAATAIVILAYWR